MEGVNDWLSMGNEGRNMEQEWLLGFSWILLSQSTFPYWSIFCNSYSTINLGYILDIFSGNFVLYIFSKLIFCSPLISAFLPQSCRVENVLSPRSHKPWCPETVNILVTHSRSSSKDFPTLTVLFEPFLYPRMGFWHVQAFVLTSCYYF